MGLILPWCPLIFIGFIDMIWLRCSLTSVLKDFDRIIPSFTGFYRVLLDFTEFLGGLPLTLSFPNFVSWNGPILRCHRLESIFIGSIDTIRFLSILKVFFFSFFGKFLCLTGPRSDLWFRFILFKKKNFKSILSALYHRSPDIILFCVNNFFY